MSSSVLTKSANQLANRPEYEHCGSFEEAQRRADAVMRHSTESVVNTDDIRFEVSDDDGDRRIQIVAPIDGQDAIFEATNYLMGQIGSHTGVNLKMVRSLTTETLVRALAETWTSVMEDITDEEGNTKKGTLPQKLMLLHTATRDGRKLRGFTGVKYHRLWDSQILDALNTWLLATGAWEAAVPTINQSWAKTNQDGTMKPCLFIGDRSSHFFVYSKERDDRNGGMRTGLVTDNSEVGARSFNFMHFLFMELCANFLIWEPKAVREYRYKHTKGSIQVGWSHFIETLKDLSHEVTPVIYNTLEAAKGQTFQRTVEPTKQEIEKAKELKVDADELARDDATARRIAQRTSLTLTQARRSVVASKLEHNHLGNDPYSIFGVVQGITDAAKAETYEDAMVSMAEAGSRLLDLVKV